jgi:multidrug efflux pump subunit AcrB
MGAILALWLTRQTVNIMTLGGLALAVGILVDEATVCVENIHTHLQRGRSIARASLDATLETTGPRLLAMLCILAIFSPTLFMTGAAKAMFLPLSLAVGFSMVTSYVLSSTLVPILSVWLLRAHEGAARSHSQSESRFARFQRRYAGLEQKLMRGRWIVVGTYVLLAGATIFLVGSSLGTEIFPRVDAGQIQLRFRAPTGTQINATEAVALQALELIKEEVGAQNVEITLGFIGVHGASYPINLIYLWNGGPEEGVLQVQLKRGSSVRIEPLKERLRKSLSERLPKVTFSFEPSDIVSRVMSLGSPTPIEVAVSGSNLGANRAFAEKVLERFRRIPSLRDLQFSQALDYPTVDVNVDRQRAGLLGVKMADVSHALVTATSSSRFVVPNYWADPNSGVAYQIQVQVPQARMDSLEQARNVPVMERGGQALLLRNVAAVTEGTTVGQYERYNMQRLITVTANIQGADLGSVAKQVSDALKDLGQAPPGVNVTVRGQVIPLQQMMDGLRTGLFVAVGVIFLLLTANFQSFKLAFIVVSTAPAVVGGVLAMLWLTGTTLNIQSFMGTIMAVGVAVANAILLVTFAERSRLAGTSSSDAAVEGASSRLRPILMTSAAMIAGMAPMALGFGEGGQQTAPLGRAVIGGLSAATVATLLFLPAVFGIVQARAHRRSASLDPDDPHSSTAEAT